MRLTPRGERVVAILVTALILILAGFAGGIEAGTIPFP